jgi:hypothetical protein
MREMAKRALSHMPNAAAEARKLARLMEVEGLKQPHQRDDPPGRE